MNLRTDFEVFLPQPGITVACSPFT